jgi:hypothetical protein
LGRERTRRLIIMTIRSISVLALLVLATSTDSLAQGRGGQAQRPMTFFVTSVGMGRGGDLGGLAGADAHCLKLATAVNAGNRTWRAYLSTQARPGQPAVNARDRIGKGPWYNSRGAVISADQSELHGDTLIQAQRGSNLFKQSALTEKGDLVQGEGDAMPNMHDILTGSRTDGRAFTEAADRTCNNWTSSTTGSAQVGHSDRIGHGNTSWNSSHATTACSQEDFASWGGTGLFYCFSPD